ncbi:MAG: NAD(+)/NADH kinase [Mailhella sp.]|nr:NAD(+)/NADH kinase [Mailhella sp.]
MHYLFGMEPVKRIMLLHKESPRPAAAAYALRTWLEARGVSAEVVCATADLMELRASAAACDAVLVLGGDGTMVGAARRLSDIRTPLVGMNYGRVGFLAALPAMDRGDWETPLAEIVAGRWRREGHLTLNWRILRREGEDWRTLREGVAINDVVTAHGVVARAVSLDLAINGLHFSSLRCDGIIVSTPLGSTAYTASAGGPLTMPSMNAQIVTPICPFAGGFPPLALPAGSSIRIESRRTDDQVLLSVDGHDNLPLEFGDVLEIVGREDQLHMLVGDKNWYLRRLIERGIVTSGPGHRHCR